jgi:hypothetical protein
MSLVLPFVSSFESFISSDAPQSTPPIVQLSPTPPIPITSEISEKESIELSTETEKTTLVQPPSPICVILDDDSSPAPSIDKKDVRQTSTTPVKKTDDIDRNSSKQSKRSRDSDKIHNKEKTSENTDVKRKRLNDGIEFLFFHNVKLYLIGNSKKVTSSSKSRSDNRSTSNRLVTK